LPSDGRPALLAETGGLVLHAEPGVRVPAVVAAEPTARSAGQRGPPQEVQSPAARRRSRDHAALINPRSWSAYCQPICNELLPTALQRAASSSSSTAKPMQRAARFHCHTACNVTTPPPGKNYATKFSLWDHLFGTADRRPGKPAGYGLADPLPDGFVAQQVHAFRRRAVVE